MNTAFLTVVKELLDKQSAIKMFLFKTCCCGIRFKLNAYMYFRTFKDCILD